MSSVKIILARLCTALALICVLGAEAVSAGGFDLDSLKTYLREDSRSPIEGIWQISGEGAVIAISRKPATQATYEVRIIDSPALEILPGQIVGELTTTGADDVWEARFAKPGKSDRPLPKSGSRDFMCKLVSPGVMRFSSFRKNRKISLWRWIPYLFRVTVSEKPTRPADADGARMIYPENHAADAIVTL